MACLGRLCGETMPCTTEARARGRASSRGLEQLPQPGHRQHLGLVPDGKAAGAISVKSYNQPRRDQRQQILEAARQTGMMVVPEGGSLFETNMNMIVDGHTGVEHAIPVAIAYDDVKQLWSQTQVGYTPTLILGYGGPDGEHFFYDTTDVWRHPILSSFVPKAILEPRSIRREKAPLED